MLLVEEKPLIGPIDGMFLKSASSVGIMTADEDVNFVCEKSLLDEVPPFFAAF